MVIAVLKFIGLVVIASLVLTGLSILFGIDDNGKGGGTYCD